MYRPLDKLQHSFFDFNQPLGMHMNPKNRWIRLADRIPWDVFEEKYAELFPSSTGNVAKPLRMALGSLIIQKKLLFSDRELVEQITENPYLQYFIGLPGYQEEPPFDASTLTLFRKRLTHEIILEANEYILDHDDENTPPTSGAGDAESSGNNPDKPENQGTLIVDATCAPVNIRYPQDVSLLNESREKLEVIIYRFCKAYNLKLPRRYSRKARKEYLAFAKSRKHTTKQIRKAIKKQLSFVHRDLGYLEQYMSEGYAPTRKEISLLLTIGKLYEQQNYERTGSYPERILVDQIYRTRANRNFCRDYGIRISGPKLGRPSKTEQAKADKKQEYQDNTDRIEIEREFSVEKRSYGLGLIVTRLETTQLTSIALSVLTANLFKMQRRILCAFLQFLENCKRDSDLKIHLLNFIGSRKEFSICT